MRRFVTLLAALTLAVPGTAFAQGAGDDQYQDPFGDEPSQSDGAGSGGDGGGLSDSPPVTGGGSSGSSSGGGSSSGSGASGAGASETATQTPAATAQASSQLPQTGSEPLLLMGLGAAFVLTGVGLRLRTIDPNAF